MLSCYDVKNSHEVRSGSSSAPVLATSNWPRLLLSLDGVSLWKRGTFGD